jgi:predicted O-methyltransferase YrrM
MTIPPGSASFTGTVFAAADATLATSPHYQAFRAGKSSRADYHRLVEMLSRDLLSAGVPQADVPFMKRFPRKPTTCVEGVLADLHRRGILPTATYDMTKLARAEANMGNFIHGRFKTYIYPEEGMLLGAIASICTPRHAVFLGSYYGYWAHWAIPSIVSAGGRVTLVDPDEECCDVAIKNLQANRLANAVNVVTTRGEHYLSGTSEMFDFVVLDAENPRDHPEPEQRGKRVYHSLMRAALPRLVPDALLVCHNILFTDTTDDPAFAEAITRNREELEPFAALLARFFGPFVEYRTTEGVGIGRFSGVSRDNLWPEAAELDLDAMS